MSLFENVLVSVCVCSCVLSAWVMANLDTSRLSRQRGHQIAGWQLAITGSITAYFLWRLVL